jgi:hypothetical protein
MTMDPDRQEVRAVWVSMLLVACGHFVSADRTYTDPVPLLTVRIASDKTLRELLPEFEVVITPQQAAETKRDDGLVELLTDVAHRTTDGRTWRVDIRVYRYASAEAAEAARVRRCTSEEQAFGREDIKQWSVPDGAACVTPVGHQRQDVGGGFLPSGRYYSYAVIRRGSVVVNLLGLRRGRDHSTMDWVVQDLAQRLSGGRAD